MLFECCNNAILKINIKRFLVSIKSEEKTQRTDRKTSNLENDARKKSS
jgi:hypothetical protein